jgi:hypothetical protein
MKKPTLSISIATTAVSLVLGLLTIQVEALAREICIESADPAQRSLEEVSQALIKFKLDPNNHEDREDLEALTGHCELYRLPPGDDATVDSNWLAVGAAAIVDQYNVPDNDGLKMYLHSTGHSLSLNMTEFKARRKRFSKVNYGEKVKVKCPNKEFYATVSTATEQVTAGEYDTADDVGVLEIGANKNQALATIGLNSKPMIYAGIPTTELKSGEIVVDEAKYNELIEKYQPVIISRSNMLKNPNDKTLFVSTCRSKEITLKSGILSFNCIPEYERSGSVLAWAEKIKKLDGSVVLGKLLKIDHRIVVSGEYVSGSDDYDRSPKARGEMNFNLGATEKDIFAYMSDAKIKLASVQK